MKSGEARASPTPPAACRCSAGSLTPLGGDTSSRAASGLLQTSGSSISVYPDVAKPLPLKAQRVWEAGSELGVWGSPAGSPLPLHTICTGQMVKPVREQGTGSGPWRPRVDSAPDSQQKAPGVSSRGHLVPRAIYQADTVSPTGNVLWLPLPPPPQPDTTGHRPSRGWGKKQKQLPNNGGSPSPPPSIGPLPALRGSQRKGEPQQGGNPEVSASPQTPLLWGTGMGCTKAPHPRERTADCQLGVSQLPQAGQTSSLQASLGTGGSGWQPGGGPHPGGSQGDTAAQPPHDP